MDSRIRLLLDGLDEAYERRSWHGPNLRGALRGVRPADAAWRPGRGRRNIWEVAVHAAYWKYAVRRRLTGEKRGSFVLEGSNWFVRPEAGKRPLAAWRSDLDLLAREHVALREAVAALRGADLDRRMDAGPYPAVFLIRGVIAHDLYHAGQIQLLKRLRPRHP